MIDLLTDSIPLDESAPSPEGPQNGKWAMWHYLSNAYPELIPEFRWEARSERIRHRWDQWAAGKGKLEVMFPHHLPRRSFDP